jgi:hypothetical protein
MIGSADIGPMHKMKPLKNGSQAANEMFSAWGQISNLSPTAKYF